MNTCNSKMSSESSNVSYGKPIGFICSKCGSTDIERQGSLFFCMECGSTHPIIDSYYNLQPSPSKYSEPAITKLPHFLIFFVSFLAALLLSMLTFITLGNYRFTYPVFLAFIGFWGITVSVLYLIYLLK